MRSPLLNLAVVMAEEEQEEHMARLRQQQQVQTDQASHSLTQWAVCEWATYEAEKHKSREMSPTSQRDAYVRHQTIDPVSPEIHIQRLEAEKATQLERIKQLERINREKDEQIRNLSPGRERAAGDREGAAGGTHDHRGVPTLTTTQTSHQPNDSRGGSHSEVRGGANGGGSNAGLSDSGGEWRAAASSGDLQQRLDSSPQTVAAETVAAETAAAASAAGEDPMSEESLQPEIGRLQQMHDDAAAVARRVQTLAEHAARAAISLGVEKHETPHTLGRRTKAAQRRQRLQLLEEQAVAQAAQADAQKLRIRELEAQAVVAQQQSERLQQLEKQAAIAEQRELELISEGDQLRGLNDEKDHALTASVQQMALLEEQSAAKVKSLQESASAAEEMERHLAALARTQGLDWDSKQKQKVVSEMLEAVEHKEDAMREIAAEKEQLEVLHAEKDRLLAEQVASAMQKESVLQQQLVMASMLGSGDAASAGVYTHGVALGAAHGVKGSGLAIRAIATRPGERQLKDLQAKAEILAREKAESALECNQQATEAHRSKQMLENARQELQASKIKYSEDLESSLAAAENAKRAALATRELEKQKLHEAAERQQQELWAAAEENRRIRQEADDKLCCLRLAQQHEQEQAAQKLEEELQRRISSHSSSQAAAVKQMEDKLSAAKVKKDKWKSAAADLGKDSEQKDRALLLAQTERDRLEHEAAAKAQALEEQQAKVAALMGEKEALELQVQMAGPKEPEWIDDETVLQCMECMAKFSLFKRKHHCRGETRMVHAVLLMVRVVLL